MSPPGVSSSSTTAPAPFEAAAAILRSVLARVTASISPCTVTIATRDAWRQAGTATAGIAASCSCEGPAGTGLPASASTAAAKRMRRFAHRIIATGYPCKKHRGRRLAPASGKVAVTAWTELSPSR